MIDQNKEHKESGLTLPGSPEKMMGFEVGRTQVKSRELW